MIDHVARYGTFYALLCFALVLVLCAPRGAF